MTDYPYGRSGYPHCHSKDTATKNQLEASAETGDNEIHIKGNTIYLYEAPMEQDPGRGHYSVWEQVEGDTYKQVSDISGDDGMCYENFQNHS